MSKDTFLRELLGRMTVEEKCGQLNLLTGTMADTGTKDSGDREAKIRAGHCGAMLNVFTPAATRALQELAVGSRGFRCSMGSVRWGTSESAGINRLETENERVLQRKPSQ